MGEAVPEQLDDGLVKARILAMGRVRVPRAVLEGYRLSRSTAGPGAGSSSLALAWTGADGREHRVKLAVAPEGDAGAPLELLMGAGGGLELRSTDGSVDLPSVTLLPIVMHAPDHAFINLDGDCVHECAFCTVHLMDGRRMNRRTPERWVELILEAHRGRSFDAIAITGVAALDHDAMLGDYETIIRSVLEALPEMVVGVEPYVTSRHDIQRLRDAGAREIKINLQSPVPDILEAICPGWSLERQYHLLEEAVSVFGKGNVTSNIIVGLGESDTDVEVAVERLCAMGVVPSVRAVRLNDLNLPNVERALGRGVAPVTPERHLLLAQGLREALERHGLTASSFRSMCHRCGCCDLEPGKDI